MPLQETPESARDSLVPPMMSVRWLLEGGWSDALSVVVELSLRSSALGDVEGVLESGFEVDDCSGSWASANELRWMLR